MEVYAGFLEYTDHHVGRLLDSLKQVGAFDDTLVYYIIGDNGASAEGTLNGTYNEMINFNGMAAIETPAFLNARIDKLGGPESYNHYAVGWAHAMSTPYQWTKQVASHWGGTRNGTIVHWPKGIKARGEMRSQFHHVIDIAPTLLEAAGLPEPISVNGVQQTPIEGVSMLYSFNDAKAAERHETQYFEMFGNRGIYHKGWTAVTRHKTPWSHRREDPGLRRRRLGAVRHEQGLEPGERPVEADAGKLHELQRLWLIEATRYNVLPLDDDWRAHEPGYRRPAGADQGKPRSSSAAWGACRRTRRQHQEQVPRGDRRDRGAEVGAEGVIIAQGGNIGGWASTRRAASSSTATTARRAVLLRRGDERDARGRTRCAWSLPTPAAALARAARSRSYVDGKPVGEGTVAATAAMIFLADDGCDVGWTRDRPSPKITAPRQCVHRARQGRADRHRRCRRELRSPRLAGGGHPDRDGATVGGTRARWI
jgi:arylsulfatase